jgi:hypothetical protein
MKPPQSNTSQVTANNNNNSRVCFNCRETGHFIANCPYTKKPTASAYSNSVDNDEWGPPEAGRVARDDEASTPHAGRPDITQPSSLIMSTPTGGSGAGAGGLAHWSHPGGGTSSSGISTTAV